MPPLTNHLEINKLLPQTNCRVCGSATCLAFAVAVMQGAKQLSDCPEMKERAGDVEVATKGPSRSARDSEEELERLRGAVAALDLAARAGELGCACRADKVTVQCLGKDFHIDPDGIITSACHVNPWLSGPILDYLAHGKGTEPTGKWVHLRELKGGEDWYRLFGQRCEKPLKKVIDGYTGLMEDMIDIFGAEPAPEMFDSDIAVVLRPLPKVPILLCYWKHEEGMDSDFHIFFDSSVEDNLHIESVYTLGVGLLTMFEKIAQTHGQ